MELSKQVCTIGQASDLRELGVKQDSLFYWFPDPNTEEIKKKYALCDYIILSHDHTFPNNQHSLKHFVLYGYFLKTYSAFNVSELGKFLDIKNNLIKIKIGDNNICVWDFVKMENTEEVIASSFFFSYKSEAHLRAEILIYLLQNKKITL